MKLTHLFARLKTPSLTTLFNHDMNRFALIPLSLLTVIAISIWFIGPWITWGDYAPLATPIKRLYLILFLFFVWLLKFLLVDLETLLPFITTDPTINKKRRLLHHHFLGAMRFLKNTTIHKQNQRIRLIHLPWYLLIGPPQAGKTSLLAYSNVQFILQRHFQGPPQTIPPTEHSEWWVTRDHVIIDIPGQYLKGHTSPTHLSNRLWKDFLQLMKQQRPPPGNGLIIALPVPEFMQQQTKRYSSLLRYFLQRIHEWQQHFPPPTPCYLLMTKCDLIPGFTEFFAELGRDELAQAWGVAFSLTTRDEKTENQLLEHLNRLIKRLNQQLIWRLHQERNPLARPFIKDFPLQMERLKIVILDLIKKLSASTLPLVLRGIYFTSATQPPSHPPRPSSDAPLTLPIQATHPAPPPSHPYFIKQLLTRGFIHPAPQPPSSLAIHRWKHRLAYTMAISMISYAIFILGTDFKQAMHQTDTIQQEVIAYEATLSPNGPDRLRQLSILLDQLQQPSDDAPQTTFRLLSFYSRQSQQKVRAIYQQLLQHRLVPEIKRYLEYYLAPFNHQDAHDIYAALKSYLMLSDTTYFQADYMTQTLQDILPKTMGQDQTTSFIRHLTRALNTSWAPLSLNSHLIHQARQYLTTLPHAELSYIILKNTDHNRMEKEVVIHTPSPLFFSAHLSHRLPYMFTAQAFTDIVSQQITTAVQEALLGNWVLGHTSPDKNIELSNALIEQLHIDYVSHYVDWWENLLAHIHLMKPDHLAQTDQLIEQLTNDHSPLLQLLQLFHDNTYFEPILSASPKLQNLGALVAHDHTSTDLLSQTMTRLRALHQYLQSILSAENEQKAAFDAVSNRLQNKQPLDAITQLRLIAEKNPDPVKAWLLRIANDAWHDLMQEAAHYIDTSWQRDVISVYQQTIANRYPFNRHATQEVDLQPFVSFFGHQGLLTLFYQTYLQPLINQSTTEWRWKTIDHETIPFSLEALKQIHLAHRINQTFFPHGHLKPLLQFTLQPYDIDDRFKTIMLHLNHQPILNDQIDAQSLSLLIWPNESEPQVTTVQLTMTNKEIIHRQFLGIWSWFKLVSESTDDIINHRKMIINLATKEHPARYLLFTENEYNPLITLHLQRFHLTPQLIEPTTPGH